ncbi:MAG: hypothetical protein ACKVRO_02895 [Micropepsaceae bacterium]
MLSSKNVALFVVVFCAVQLSACASIIKGSTAAINVTSPPITGANCILSSGQGSWQVTTPASVTVERSKEDIQVRCTKEGYQDATAIIPSNFEGWTVGNLIFGGIVGVGVDAATGAMNDYPNAFQVPMTPLNQVMLTPPPGTPSVAPLPKQQ